MVSFGSESLLGSTGRGGRGWCTKEGRGGFKVSLWRAIRRDWEKFNCRTSFFVGNDRRMKL